MNAMKLEQAIVVGEELAVRFADGAEIYLPLPYLRANCPCAACQQNRDDLAAAGFAKANAPGVPLTAVDVVGGYAVRLVWGDGHGSGIYSFDLLRNLDGLLRGNGA
jgi:DUF971 family protein